MVDPRIEKLADTIIDYSLQIKKGDFFQITSPPIAAPLIEALYLRAVQRGAFVYPDIHLPQLAPLFLKHASDTQLDWVPPTAPMLMERVDARFAILADTNTKALTSADPAKQMRRQRATSGIMETMMSRAASGALLVVAHTVSY